MKKENLKDIIYKGSPSYLRDETTPIESPSSNFLAELANNYSSENPLYIIAIGAITNIASAILKNPKIIDNCVLIWLGGNATHLPFGVLEFNMVQDIAASRIVFGGGIPLIQLPCAGVVDHFSTSKYELEHWLKGKNALCDYLCNNTIKEAESYAKEKPWTRIIWDVTAVAWLLNENDRFMKDKLMPSPIPEYDKHYAFNENRHLIKYVYTINRDELFEDLFTTLGNAYENI